MSDVRVVVIDCTDTGASPPTATEPTWICRLFRRSASLVGTDGMPREIAVICCATPSCDSRSGPGNSGLQASRLRHAPRPEHIPHINPLIGEQTGTVRFSH